MPIGIYNQTNVSLANITDLVNVTSYTDFLVNMNTMIYEGILFFVVLWVLWVILFYAAQSVKDQILNNMMYSGAAVTILAFLLRVIGLLSDHLMWVFPLLTIVIALIVWATKD